MSIIVECKRCGHQWYKRKKTVSNRKCSKCKANNDSMRRRVTEGISELLIGEVVVIEKKVVDIGYRDRTVERVLKKDGGEFTCRYFIDRIEIRRDA